MPRITDHKIDPDNDSLASSFVSVSPAQSITSTAFDAADDQPPPYSAVANTYEGNSSSSWTARDPRSSSTQSLGTADAALDGRRRLLLVYIHGFMGNETSFQGFPAHVHNLTTVLLSSSHVVHTKIYPRYRSKRPIQVATGDFSRWLEPHESPNTDVVLLGHSMGGLLSAEIVLLPSGNPTLTSPLRHRIIGSINFDTPFLGMHPGIIKAGLGSIFKPAAKPSASPQRAAPHSYLSSLVNGFSNLQTQNYNPRFSNDVQLPARKGWDSAFHFVNKHSKNLRQATTQLITSHMEFGSCLADYEGLKTRYCRIRMLEEEEASKRQSVSPGGYGSPPRIRFTNYYTASTGRPKKPKPPSHTPSGGEAPVGSPLTPLPSYPRSDSGISNPAQHRPSLGAHTNSSALSISSASTLSSLASLDPLEDTSTTTDPDSITSPTSQPTSTAPIPPLAQPPTPPGEGPIKQFFLDDLDAFTYAVTIHRADLKAYARALKDYHRSLKAHRKAENERLRKELKASVDAVMFDLKSNPLPAELANSENASGDAKTLADKKVQARAIKDRRRREYDTLRAQLKKQVDDEKARRKAVSEAAKAEKKAGKQAVREDREQIKSALKEGKMARKDARKGSSNASSCGARNDIVPAGFNPDAGSSRSQSSTTTTTTASTALSSPRPSISTPTSYPYPPEKRPLPRVGSSTSTSTSAAPEPNADPQGKPKKDRKFCILPPADASGSRDPTWQRVYMQGVDEVGAHCGLFFPQGAEGQERPEHGDGDGDSNGWGERYARLVGDVAERVEGWVLEAETARVVRESTAGLG